MRQIGGIISLFLCTILVGCKEETPVHPYQDLSLSYYDSLRNPNYSISARKVRWYIDSMRIAAHDTAYADVFVNKYYASDEPYIWINLRGADYKTDDLCEILATADSDAIRKAMVFEPQVRKALSRLREFSFTSHDDINRCLAEIEYFSTKGLVRMSNSLRYGVINPYKLMNRLDLENPDDSLCTTYRTLYDTPTETPNKQYFNEILASAANGNFAKKISEARPTDNNYLRLRQEYHRPDIGSARRRTLAVNMERFRWRTEHSLEKYVWINLPEFMLRAQDSENGETLEMKVCEGSLTHKTPTLTSSISRLELNPVWTVPQSIISREIAPKHAEDASYFERNRMKIIEKATGDEVAPETVTAEMLRSAKYNIVQTKGEGNSLGRMIFRFKNNFAIFLHDTPIREAFNQKFRAASHGCIRLENPLALAVFMLSDKDPLVIDKIKIAIGQQPETDEGKRLAADTGYKPMGLKTFKPEVPLYITYFTAYPSPAGNSVTYTADPYRYDAKIDSLLNNYK